MSKTPTDLLGNELTEGALVRVALTEAAVIGTIQNIRLGGIAVGDGRKETQGSFEVHVKLTCPFPPGARLGDVLRLVDPASQKFVEKLADKLGSPLLVMGSSGKEPGVLKKTEPATEEIKPENP